MEEESSLESTRFPNEEPAPQDAKAASKTQSESVGGDEKSLSLTPDLASSSKRTGSSPKRKRSRGGVSDANAPKVPLTGYVRFLQDNRDRVKKENPNVHYSEITRILAAKWANLEAKAKQKYLDDAQRDREQYIKDLKEYQQTDAYKDFVRSQNEKKKEKIEQSSQGSGVGSQRNRTSVASIKINVARSTLLQQQILTELELEEDDLPGCDIPIFTDEFLEHNKAKETELRSLRKSNADLEEQNSILNKHIGNMKMAIEKLEREADQQQIANTSLQKYLTTLKNSLVKAFVSVPLPDTAEVPTLDTIDTYLGKLSQLVQDNVAHAATFVAKVKDIVKQLNYEEGAPALASLSQS